jgi:hypothetical protein
MAYGLARASTEGQYSAVRCAAITPHASNTFEPTRGIMVTAAGTVSCRFEDDSSDVTITVQAGVLYPFAIRAVRVTGTTATGIFGLY